MREKHPSPLDRPFGDERYKESDSSDEDPQKDLYRCDICDKTIKYKQHIHRHMKQVHGDQKIYECEIVLPNGVKCLNSYKRKENLRRHQKIWHVGHLK